MYVLGQGARFSQTGRGATFRGRANSGKQVGGPMAREGAIGGGGIPFALGKAPCECHGHRIFGRRAFPNPPPYKPGIRPYRCALRCICMVLCWFGRAPGMPAARANLSQLATASPKKVNPPSVVKANAEKRGRPRGTGGNVLLW